MDAGPDSIDYVTGTAWGALSGGGQVPYQGTLGAFDGDDYLWSGAFDDYRDAHFAPDREAAFRYGLYVDTFGGSDFSGVARVESGRDAGSGSPAFGVGGQDFIVARGVIDDHHEAGTFMHELGHTLGLGHGGDDHENYKPNYLSVMNYYFQLAGIPGAASADYSQWELPALEESAIDESAGVDPAGLTAGSGYGTMWTCPDGWFGTRSVRTAVPVAAASLDFSCNGTIDSGTAELDVARDGGRAGSGSLDVLVGFDDWENLIYAGGSIGALGASVVAPGPYRGR